MRTRPGVSVIVPTYKRPEQLERAVRSVLAQTHADFELVICDDEPSPGAGREVAERLAREDGRIRVVANPGPHGQVGNVNYALREAKREWISILYDDDVMEPTCLATMLDAISAAATAGGEAGKVSLARCLTRFFTHGKFSHGEPLGKRARVELIRKEHVAMAFITQDMDIGIPSQIMVPRHLIQRGLVMEQDPKLKSNVDTLWFMRLLREGSLLLVNEGLVQQHQGGHETVTSAMTEEALYEEFHYLRELQFNDMTPEDRRRMPLSTVQGELRLIRMLRNLTRRKFGKAAALALATPNPRAWWLAGRWLLRRKYPGRFEIVPREVIDR